VAALSHEERIKSSEARTAPQEPAQPVAPLCWVRTLNGEIDWAEDCLSPNEAGAVDCYDGDGYAALALYAVPPSHPAPSEAGAERQAWLVDIVKRARSKVLDEQPCNSMHIEALDFFVAAIMLLADPPSISKASPKLHAALKAAQPAKGDASP